MPAMFFFTWWGLQLGTGVCNLVCVFLFWLPKSYAGNCNTRSDGAVGVLISDGTPGREAMLRQVG